MKKIYNYVLLKLSSFKILVILGSLLFYHFLMYLFLIGESNYHNIYDLFNNQFSYFSLFIVYSLGYLLIIYNVNQKDNFYKYYYLRFNNKLEVFNTTVCSLAIISLLFILFIDIFTIAEGIFTMPLTNSYSEYFYRTMTGTINVFYETDNVNILTNMISPITYILLLNILSFLYFFLQGLLYIVIDSFINKEGLSLIIVIAINALNWYIDAFGGIISRLSFTNNIYFITSQIDDISNYSFIFFRIIYWIILLLPLYIIGRRQAIKGDYKFIN